MIERGHRLDPRRWSAGTRIAVGLVVAALVPMVVVAFAGVTRGRQAVEGSQLTNVAATAQFSSATLNEFISGVVAQADQLATQPEVVAALASLDPTTLASPLDPGVLSSVLTSSPDFSGVMLLGRTGVVVDGLPSTAAGSGPYGSQGWFYDALGGSAAVSEIIAGTQPSSLSMYVAVPARPAGSAAVGVVAIEVRAEAVLWALNQAPQTPGSQVLLTNRETVVVGARDHRLRYSALGDLSDSVASLLVTQRGYPVETIESLDMEGFGETMAGEGTITETYLPGAGAQIVAYDQVGDHSMWVVVAEPRATFLEPIESLARQIMVAGLVIGALAVIAAVVIARRVSRPITAITQAAASVERGESVDEDRLERYTHGRSDIADLARVMRQMVREVAERERRLRAQLKALKVEIDHERRAKEVAEVTETDFFKDLESRAAEMRARAKGEGT